MGNIGDDEVNYNSNYITSETMPSREGVITVQLEKKSRNHLMKLDKKGESYDQIINKLVDFWLKRKR